MVLRVHLALDVCPQLSFIVAPAPILCPEADCLSEPQFTQVLTGNGHTYWRVVVEAEGEAEWLAHVGGSTTRVVVVVVADCSGYTHFLLQKMMHVFHVHTRMVLISPIILYSDADK